MKADYSLDRGMPASKENETAILGAILLDNRAYPQTVGRIEADDFSLDSHRRIFQRMTELFDRNEPVDFNTLTVELDKHKEVEAVGGVSYVTSLTDSLPRVKNIEHYVSIVRDKSQLRKIIHQSNATIEQAYTAAEPAADIATKAMESMLDIYRTGGKPVPTLKEIGQRCFSSMNEQLARKDGSTIGLTTALDQFDLAITGYRKKKYYVIGGRPSMGKTSLILQAIRAACLAGKRVGFFSIDTADEEDVFNRLAAMETGIHVESLQDARLLTRQEIQVYQNAIGEITNWPLELRCGPMSLREIKAASRLMIAKGCEMLVLDYLQHPSIRVPGKDKDEFSRVTEISSVLCDIGKSNNVAMVALSQLSRPDKREDRNREPTMSDLYKSGQIEADADVIALLFREQGEPRDDGSATWTGRDKVILAKQKNGRAGIFIPVTFYGPTSEYMTRAEAMHRIEQSRYTPPPQDNYYERPEVRQ